MKRSLLLGFILLLTPTLVFAKKKKMHYPVVISATDAQLIDDKLEVVKRLGQHEEVPRKMHVGQNLKDKALIRVGDNGQIRIDLGPQDSLIIFGNSIVEIPVIAWEDGATERINLQKGRIRYACESNCKRLIHTDLYEETPSDGDYVYTYEPLVPKIEAMVLSGQLQFRGYENESIVSLKPGQKASFTGVIEGGEIGYDILLKGRKVAKGHPSKADTLSDDEKKKFEKLFSEKKTVVKKKVSTRLDSQICDKPYAELNQCRWVCEDNPKKSKNCAVDQGARCVRSRCNANGEWAEAYELPKDQSRCGTKAVVDACDY